MTIGIIEDDRLLSRSLKVVLEKEGYRTLQVYTKKDAGQILQGTEELLLVDIGEGDISYGKRVSAPGISDEKSGAGSDQRKYFGACMGN